MDIRTQVIEEFQKQYGKAPVILARAPGRVNLIGEHTDYNDGFVLPIAINKAVWIALGPTQDDTITLYSADYQEEKSFSLRNIQKEDMSWIEYVKGVAHILQEKYLLLTGFKGVIAGDVPKGAGLSSSAAVEIATARAFASTENFPWNAVEMAKAGQKAENAWVGVNCGIMDQMISAGGKKDRALLIDCRSLETELIPLPPRAKIVILDTGTRRGLVDSEYNERRAKCEEVARFFGVKALRDVSIQKLNKEADKLPPISVKRAKHVITENDRVLEAVKAMKNDDAKKLGLLMNESHESLRDDFEVSSEALNVMVEISQMQSGCYGARMTGAGFGGCAVALVQENVADKFASKVAKLYSEKTNNTPHVYVTPATAGASVEKIVLQ